MSTQQSYPVITPTFRYSLINSNTATKSIERDGTTFTAQDSTRWSGFQIHTPGKYTLDVKSLTEDKASLKITGAKNVDRLDLSYTLFLVVTKECVRVYQTRHNIAPSDVITKTEDEPLEIKFKNAMVDTIKHSISEYEDLEDVNLIRKLEDVTLEQEDAVNTDLVNQDNTTTKTATNPTYY